MKAINPFPASDVSAAQQPETATRVVPHAVQHDRQRQPRGGATQKASASSSSSIEFFSRASLQQHADDRTVMSESHGS